MDTHESPDQQSFNADEELKRRRIERAARVNRWRESQRINESPRLDIEPAPLEPATAPSPPPEKPTLGIRKVAAFLAAILVMLGVAIWYVEPSNFASIDKPLAAALRSASNALENRHVEAVPTAAPHQATPPLPAGTPLTETSDTFAKRSAAEFPNENVVAPTPQNLAVSLSPPPPPLSAEPQVPPVMVAETVKPAPPKKPERDEMAELIRREVASHAPPIGTPPPEVPTSTQVSQPVDVLPGADRPPLYEAPVQTAVRAPTSVTGNTKRVANLTPVIVLPQANPRRPVTQPPYPSKSRDSGETGTVVMRLTVDKDGYVRDAEVDRSSSFPRLDQAAVEEARHSWKFIPGTVDGTPTAMQRKFAVTFQF